MSRAYHERHYRNENIPLWLRIHHYAASHINRDCRVILSQGELVKMFDKSSSAISHAINKAIECGFLEPGSGLRELRLNPADMQTARNDEHWRRSGR